MPLVNTPRATQFLMNMGIDTGRRAYLGNPENLPARPATTITKLHYVMADAVKRVTALEFDKTRTPAQQHHAGRRIAEATIAEFAKARTEIKTFAASETDAAMSDIQRALSPEPGKAALYSEIRAFCLARKGDPDFVTELGSLIETNPDFAIAVTSAPAVLSGIPEARKQSYFADAAAKFAPEAAERLQNAMLVGDLDGKLASAQAEIAPSFYLSNVEAGMASRVDVDARLGAE